MKSQLVLVALGSNLGHRRQFIQMAMEAIASECGSIVATADLFTTKPVGLADQEFINTAIIVSTLLTPSSFLKTTLDIEQKLGRTREIHWGNRTIDIDLILWKNLDQKTISYDDLELKIPHPLALERKFVMDPCVQIAPMWIHPKTQRSLKVEYEMRWGKKLPPLGGGSKMSLKINQPFL